jgi:GTP-binding protein
MTQSDQFVDEAIVTTLAGDGGNGLASFRREKFVPRGGPNGGDGGRGGNVVFMADRNLGTLRDQKYRHEIRAAGGEHGGTNNRFGAGGEDTIVRVPIGTVLYDLADEGEVLHDLSEDGERFVVAKGGQGGHGNTRFKTSTRQAPDFATRGMPGQRRKLRLSLKLLADVGLVGLPNAGKSTLLRRISAARPRVADYPFTTLTPNLGVAEIDHRTFVVADIPGLIEGASEGVGLGDRFLRHIERTRVLVHLLDGAALLDDSRDLLSEYETIRAELEAYGEELGQRREIVLLNKTDLSPDTAPLDAIEKTLRERGLEVLRGSGATGDGIAPLVRAMARAIDAVDAEEADEGTA